MKKILLIIAALVVIGGVTGLALNYAFPVQMATIGGLTRNYILSLNAPAGTTTTESNPDYKAPSAPAAAPEASLQFLFYGGVVVLPVIAAYTIGVYWVFRGKVRKGYGRTTAGGI